MEASTGYLHIPAMHVSIGAQSIPQHGWPARPQSVGAWHMVSPPHVSPGMHRKPTMQHRWPLSPHVCEPPHTLAMHGTPL